MSEDNSFFALVDENEELDDNNEKKEPPKTREFSPERKKQFNRLLNSMMFFWVYNCYTHSNVMWRIEDEGTMRTEIMKDLNDAASAVDVGKDDETAKNAVKTKPGPMKWFIDTVGNYAKRRDYTEQDIENYIRSEAMKTVGEYNYMKFAKNLPPVKEKISVNVPTIKVLKVKKRKLNDDYAKEVDPGKLVGHIATRIAFLPYMDKRLDGMSKTLIRLYLPTLQNWEETSTKKLKEKWDKTMEKIRGVRNHGERISKALKDVGDAKRVIEQLIIRVLKLYKTIPDKHGTKQALADYVVNYSEIKPKEFGFVANDWGELKPGMDVRDEDYEEKQVNYVMDEPIATLRRVALEKNRKEDERREAENEKLLKEKMKKNEEETARLQAEEERSKKEKTDKENLEKLKKGAKFGLAEVLLEEVDDGEETDSVETCSEQLKRIREECLELLEKIEKPSIVLKMGDKVYLKVGGITDQLKETEKVGDYRKLLNGVLDAAKKNCDSYLEDVSGLGKKRLKEVKGILDQEIKGAKKFINSDTKLDKMFYLTVESLVEKDNIKKPMELLKNRKKMDTSELFKGEYKNDYEKILKKIETQRGDEPLLKLGSKTGNIIAHFWVVEQKIKKYTNKMGKNRLEIVESKFNNSIETFHNNLRAALEKAGVTDLWSNITNTTVEYEEEKKNQEEEKKRRLEESKTISGISDLSSSDNSSIISDSSKEASINKIKSVKMTDMENLEKSKTERDVPIQDIKSRKQSGTSGNESTEEAESTVYKRVKSIKSADGQSQNEYEKENETDDDDDLFADEESSARRNYSDADA